MVKANIPSLKKAIKTRIQRINQLRGERDLLVFRLSKMSPSQAQDILSRAEFLSKEINREKKNLARQRALLQSCCQEKGASSSLFR